MGTLIFTIKRLAYLILLLFGVATCVFFISKMVPGDAVSAYLSPRSLANPDIVAAFKEKWGLNDSLWVQYLNYMTNLVKLDLGVSIRTGNPVVEELGRSYPATMELAFFSILFASIMGILFGIVSATKRNSFIDQWLRAISVTGVSIPSFWFAIIVLFIFYSKLGWAPGIGRLSLRVSPPEHISGMYVLDGLLTGNIIAVKDALAHLILPAIVLGSFTMGLITRTTRSSLLETLSSDYIRTARAKGLTDRGIMVVHAFGNAAIPVLTVIGVGFGNLLGGMVVVEKIFAWPGVGQFAYQSVLGLDFPAIIGVSLLIAVNYAVINLIIDLLYGVIDPRVRVSR